MSIELTHPLPDPLVELIAQRFRVLAEPTRIKLLDHLRDGPATVGELVEATGCSQQNASKHLRILLDAGFVAREQAGNCAVYSIADPTVFDICEVVCGALRTRLAGLEEAIAEGVRA